MLYGILKKPKLKKKLIGGFMEINQDNFLAFNCNHYITSIFSLLPNISHTDV